MHQCTRFRHLLERVKSSRAQSHPRQIHSTIRNNKQQQGRPEKYKGFHSCVHSQVSHSRRRGPGRVHILDLTSNGVCNLGSVVGVTVNASIIQHFIGIFSFCYIFIIVWCCIFKNTLKCILISVFYCYFQHRDSNIGISVIIDQIFSLARDQSKRIT